MDGLRLLSAMWFMATVLAMRLASKRGPGEKDDKASIRRVRKAAAIGGTGFVSSQLLLLYLRKRRGELEVTWSKAWRMTLYSILTLGLRFLLIDRFNRRPRGKESG